MNTILVPIDPGGASELVLAHARAIAKPGDDLILLHVMVGGWDPGRSDAVAEKLESMAAGLPDLRARVLIESGDPADRIQRIALALNVHLIVMGTQARMGLARLLLGSVASRVVRESPVPVLLVGPGCRVPAHAVERILVTLDGSARSERMIEAVRPLGAGLRAEVVLLHVEDPEAPAPFEVAADRPMKLRDAGRPYEDLADALDSSGVTAWSVVVRGRPAEAIAAQARALDADVIAMTTHGRTGLEAALIGSVTEGVLRHADRPVLLLRAAAAPRAARKIG